MNISSAAVAAAAAASGVDLHGTTVRKTSEKRVSTRDAVKNSCPLSFRKLTFDFCFAF